MNLHDMVTVQKDGRADVSASPTRTVHSCVLHAQMNLRACPGDDVGEHFVRDCKLLLAS